MLLLACVQCYTKVCEETNALLVVITQRFNRGSDGMCTTCIAAEGDHINHNGIKYCRVSSTSLCPPPQCFCYAQPSICQLTLVFLCVVGSRYEVPSICRPRLPLPLLPSLLCSAMRNFLIPGYPKNTFHGPSLLFAWTQQGVSFHPRFSLCLMPLLLYSATPKLIQCCFVHGLLDNSNDATSST
jgi:hypothetical protein